MISLLFLSALMLFSVDSTPIPPPVLHPRKPAPNWSWDTIPIAYHGANRSGMFTDDAIQQMSKYNMVTIEKWYTACASKGPTQSGPECDVEDRMFDTFKKIKSIRPDITTIMYLNSNFDFAFYNLHAKMMARERAGKKSYLRDRHGNIVSLCNDGNVYCNITTFDHANQDVNELWTEALLNATKVGAVDGVFADHGNANPKPLNSSSKYAQMCNGKGEKRKCWEFDLEFAINFTAGHNWLLNNTQDVLSKKTSGPVICGYYANWHKPTDFEGLRAVVARGQAGTGPFVIEASVGGCDVAGDPSRLAGYLMAMGNYTYLSCFHSMSTTGSMPKFYDAYSKPLGKPTGPATEDTPGSGQWTRHFINNKGTTTAYYHSKTKKGHVQWAGEVPTPAPPPTPMPPTPPPTPIPTYCGTILNNTGMAHADLGGEKKTTSYGECCFLCHNKKECVIWSWHKELGGVCHFHTANAYKNSKTGCISGFVNSTYLQ